MMLLCPADGGVEFDTGRDSAKLFFFYLYGEENVILARVESCGAALMTYRFSLSW